MLFRSIRAIGIARGVRDYELSRFLHVIANIDRTESATAFLTKISSLNLVNIKVLTRSIQADLLVPGLAPGLINALSNIPNFNAQGGSLEDAFNQSSSTSGNKNNNNSRDSIPRAGKHGQIVILTLCRMMQTWLSKMLILIQFQHYLDRKIFHQNYGFACQK